MAIGQRYDVIITANQAAGNYWFRASNAPDCASDTLLNGKSIFTYTGSKFAQPSTTGFASPTNCSEPTGLVPYWPTTIPSTDFHAQVKTMDINLGIPNVTTNNQNIVSWIVNMTAMDIDWRDPTLQ
jgi:Multicopper oxidase